MDGFAFDDFERTDELIAIGEESMRAALPELKKKLGIIDAKVVGAEQTRSPATISAAVKPTAVHSTA